MVSDPIGRIGEVRFTCRKVEALSNSHVLGQKTVRLDALTGLRWWAAFVVFFYHMRVFAPFPGPAAAVFDYGYLGVTFFFVLSGFVLTWSARPSLPITTFYWRRFARIWPLHIVALAVAIPVFYTLAPIPEGSFLKPFDLGIILLSVVLLQGWSSNPAILFSGNPAAWTLTCEAFFYALHPWISRFLVPLARRGAIIVAALTVVYAFGYRLGVVLWPDSMFGSLPLPIERLPEFVLGMALAWAMRNGWRPRLHPVLGIGSLFGVIILLAAINNDYLGLRAGLYLIPAFTNELFTVACAAAIVSLAAQSLRGKKSMFDTKLQVKLGEWSFAFYLIHATIIYLALSIFGPQAPSWKNVGWLIAILAVDLVAAWALHSYLERPVEKRMRGWKDRRDQARLSLRSS